MTRREKSYESYIKWYNKYALREPDMYTDKLSYKKFAEFYENARKAGIKNIPRTFARHQRKWNRGLERQLKKSNIILTGKETNEEREQMFLNFANNFGDFREAEEAWEALYV